MAAIRPRSVCSTGSHYDTVRNGGKYDGRLGILVPMACVRELHRAGKRLPFGFEVVGFAEEEGQRYKAVFLGSGALTGHFDPSWLDQIRRRRRHHAASDGARGLRIADNRRAARAIRRQYLGFVEVHIEQGPVLNEMDLPLGIVTSVNGSVRYVGEVIGMASHAGTTPMDRRRDAAAAVAELVLAMEQRGGAVPNLVATVGMLTGLDQRDTRALPVQPRHSRHDQRGARRLRARHVLATLEEICTRRGVHYRIEETVRAAAAPSAPEWQHRWGARGRSPRAAGDPHAERRRPRRDEAARDHAAGDVVRARTELGHQP